MRRRITIASKTGRSATRSPIKPAAQQAGQIQLANFQNPSGLNGAAEPVLPTDASGEPTVGLPGGQEGLGHSSAGLHRRQANVSVVEVFINLIVAQRGYEANSKVVQAADQNVPADQ